MTAAARKGRRSRALLLPLLLGCASDRVAWTPSWAGYLPEERAAYAEARRLIEAAEWDAVWELVAPLVAAHEENVELGALLQDIELERLERGRSPAAFLAGDAGGEPAPELAPADALQRHYARRAQDLASPARLILAARAESDAIAALTLLERALEADPESAWAHYGRAHAVLQDTGLKKRWATAREALEAALARDPGSIRARRLQAWMLAQEGASAAAANALRAWLEHTRDDPRVAPGERVDAELDLALLQVLAGQPGEARRLLLRLEGTQRGRDRRLMILAAAEQALGDADAALDAARRARGASAGGVLPAVQKALLYEYWLDDAEAATREWERVIEAAASSPEMSTLLEAMRAQAMLERAAERDEPREGGRR